MKKITGYTLVEVMLVIGIIAVIATLAVPSYINSVRKGRRAEAQTALIEFAGIAERVFTQTNSYATAGIPANTDFYTYTFPVAVTATTYTIRATPTDIQNSDKCGTMNLTHAGQKTHSGSDTDCW